MGKRKDEPTQPYFVTRDAFEASRKAVEQAMIELLTAAKMATSAPDVGDLSRRFLSDSVNKLERAIYGQE